MNELVSTNWLYKNLKNKKIVVFDCTWPLPGEKINAKKIYEKDHIYGSFFFNIEKISNKKTKLPHMLPDIQTFIKATKDFNIHNDTKIITYSTNNIVGAARVWWMFKFFGLDNVSLLNGGLNKWKKEKKTLTSNKSKYSKSTFKFQKNQQWLTSKNEILLELYDKKIAIIDARNSSRFHGIEKEPRKKLRVGHIPNSQNIYWKDLTKNSNLIISKSDIQKIFFKHKLINKKKVIFTCGSGMTACVLSLLLKHGLDVKGSVYDGSWTEWGSDKKIPIEI